MRPLRDRFGAMCLVAGALLAGAGCGGGGPGAANVDSVSCKTADDCVYLPPCAERATCEGGVCRYEAKRCDTPPAPECVSGDTVYRISISPGTCQADGTCSYQTNEMSCGSCATQCLGTCQGMSCSDLQHGCRTAGRCVPGSPPTCFYDPAPATQGCDDGDLCTYGDHCDASGHCAATTVSCVSDAATCGVKRKCNGTATCDESYPGADVTCDDGSAVTSGDHCDGAGHCVGTGVTCTSDPGPCGAVRKANGTSTCTVSYPGTSVGCDDGSASTYGDHCNGAGACVGTAVTCTSDAGPCGATRTVNGTSTCTVSYPGTSTSCDDGSASTYGDHCNGAGSCVGTAVTCSSDAGPCGATRTANGTASCTVSYPGTSTSCDDGKASTYGDHCNGAGSCVGTAVTCSSDAGPCGATRTANGTATCTVSYPGTSVGCDDGSASTYGDHCNGAGSCVGTAVSCVSDPGPCGATRTANGTASCTVSYPGTSVGCDDGSASTYSDHCDGAGHCTGTGITCTSDPGPCGAVRTANGTSQCTVTYPGTSTSCNDGNACTKSDHCDGAGHCGGTAYTCASDDCGENACDGSGGCNARTATRSDGAACGVVQGSSECHSCMSGYCRSGCMNGTSCQNVSQSIWVCR